jgi:hypothetical protein
MQEQPLKAEVSTDRISHGKAEDAEDTIYKISDFLGLAILT